jgi:hypothetical protein
MRRTLHPRRFLPGPFARLALVLAFATCARPALATGEDDAPAEPGANARSSGPAEREVNPRQPVRAGPRREPRRARSNGPDGWNAGMAGIAVVLAVFGGIAVAARRFGPRPPVGAVRVIGRVSLSPKHAVYTLRAGRHV